jgi:hypothetical protein
MCDLIQYLCSRRTEQRVMEISSKKTTGVRSYNVLFDKNNGTRFDL